MIALWSNPFSHPWVYYALVTIYVVSILGTIIVILSENRSPVKSLAWVTILVLLPMMGIVLYIVFGRSIKNVRMISRRNRRRLRKKESFRKIKFDQLRLKPESVQQIRLARTLSGAIYYPGNDVQVFSNGSEKFEALLQDIAQAKSYINIQYYIFANDEIGKRVAHALMAKAAQGVAVRVIYDHVGSFKTPDRFFRKLAEAGVQAHPFFKVVFPPFGTRINWRNHRKIVVIDGKIGYIGGMNIADRYIDGRPNFENWRDTHLRIVGPAVGALQFSFAVDWNFMGHDLIEDSVDTTVPVDLNSGAGLQLLTSGPTSQWSNICLLFIKAIGNARQRIYLQTPYFLPTEGLLRALQTAALSGIDVRLMMPMHSDSHMLDSASHSYVHECLQAGIKIYLYQGGMLHAKAMIVDDEFASVGSTNLDFRSFEYNFEANFQIYSKEVNERLCELFLADQAKSQRLTLAEWRKRPFMKKVAESLVRLLSPIL